MMNRKYQYLHLSVVLFLLCTRAYSLSVSSSSFASNGLATESSQPESSVFKDEKIFSFNEPASTEQTDFSEFVARVRGGARQAKKLAKQFDLKLIRRVFQDSNYFLFQYEYPSQINSFKLHQEQNKDFDYSDNEQDNLNDQKLNWQQKPKRSIKSSRTSLLSSGDPAEKKRLKRRSLDFNELDRLKREPSVSQVSQVL
jgi:hypothetical protein